MINLDILIVQRHAMPCLLLQQGEKLGNTGKTGKREMVNGKMSKIKSKLNCFVAVVRVVAPSSLLGCCSNCRGQVSLAI